MRARCLGPQFSIATGRLGSLTVDAKNESDNDNGADTDSSERYCLGAVLRVLMRYGLIALVDLRHQNPLGATLRLGSS